jgi:hypothetical protein
MTKGNGQESRMNFPVHSAKTGAERARDMHRTTQPQIEQLGDGKSGIEAHLANKDTGKFKPRITLPDLPQLPHIAAEDFKEKDGNDNKLPMSGVQKHYEIGEGADDENDEVTEEISRTAQFPSTMKMPRE